MILPITSQLKFEPKNPFAHRVTRITVINYRTPHFLSSWSTFSYLRSHLQNFAFFTTKSLYIIYRIKKKKQNKTKTKKGKTKQNKKQKYTHQMFTLFFVSDFVLILDFANYFGVFKRYSKILIQGNSYYGLWKHSTQL